MLVQDCKQHFNTEDLYEVLHLSKESASAAEIKKAYYKQSMKWHPDKANDDEEAKQNATVKFQIITKVYGILSDKEKRAVYDETGAVDEENVISSDDTLNMWRTIFKKVSLEDIEKFCKKYKGSDDEKNDVIANYNLWNGDMGKIMESTIGSTHEDEERIKAIIDDLISEDVLKMTKKYRTTTSQKNTSSRKKAALREAKEAEEMLKEIQAREGAKDLSSLILKRQANRGKDMDSYFDSLAEKYAPSKAKKSKK